MTAEQRRGKAKAKLIVGSVLTAYGAVAFVVGLSVALFRPNQSESTVYIDQAAWGYAGWELGMGTIWGLSLIGVGASELRRENAAASTASLVSFSF